MQPRSIGFPDKRKTYPDKRFYFRDARQFVQYRATQEGISLLEFLVIVIVIALMGSCFYPKLEQTEQEQHRNQAEVALVGLTHALHEFKAEQGTFSGAAGSVAEPRMEGSPWIVSAEVPGGGAQTYYRLRIAFANELGFEVRAVPVDDQIADDCGTLTLTSTFQPGMLNARNGLRRADCWDPTVLLPE